MKMKLHKTKIALILLFIMSINHTVNAQNFDPQLQQLIKKATLHSHQIKQNDAEIRITQIDRSSAYKTFLPKISLQADYTHLNDALILDPKLQLLLQGTEKLLIKEHLGMPFNVALPPSVPTTEIAPLVKQNRLKSAANMEWVLFSGLEVHFAVKATKHKEKAIQYQNQIVTKQITQEVIKNYDRLALLQASDKVLSAGFKQLDVQERRVQSAMQNGLAIPIDLQRIALARQKLEMQQNELQNNIALVQAKLAQMTGESIQKIAQIQAKLKPFVLAKNAQMLDKTPAEIEALNEASKALGYLKKKAYGKYLPKIAIKGHYELLDNDLSLLDPKWYVGIGVKWRIFDGLHAYDQARKLQLKQTEYQEKISEAQELISLAQTKSQLDYDYANKQILLHQKSVILAKKTYQMLLKQYQNGLTNITDVLAGLTDWQKADFALQKAIFQQRQSAVEWLYRKDLLKVNN